MDKSSFSKTPHARHPLQVFPKFLVLYVPSYLKHYLLIFYSLFFSIYYFPVILLESSRWVIQWVTYENYSVKFINKWIDRIWACHINIFPHLIGHSKKIKVLYTDSFINKLYFPSQARAWLIFQQMLYSNDTQLACNVFFCFSS